MGDQHDFGEAFFDSYCQSCHAASSPNRFGAPEGVSFDTEAEVSAQLERVQAVVIDGGSMPPGGGVLEADLSELERYLACLGEGT